MSKAIAPPARQAAAGRSNVDRSWRLLAGSSTAATTIVLLWLVVAALSGRPGASRSALVVAIEPPGLVADVLPPVDGDARLVAGAIGLAGNGSASLPGDLERQLEALAAAPASAPRVVWLSAVGVSAPDGEGGTRPYFLPVGGDPGDPGSLIPADRVVALLADRERAGGPVLLILDDAHLDSDRGAGVFANAFLHRLEALIPRDGNLAVLTPCAPGQVSWSAEPFGRSVFADCVARSASWGRGTASDLLDDVGPRVASWARSHRGAEQTPLLLGNSRRRFRLPPLRGVVPDPSPPAVADELKEQLRAAWTMHRELAEARPDRVSPLAWRRYRDDLLRAERLVRAGRTAEAGLALSAAGSLAGSIRQQLDAPPPAGLPSYALRIALAPPGRREAIRREWEEFERLARRSLDGEAPAADLTAAGSPPAGGEPADGSASPAAPAADPAARGAADPRGDRRAIAEGPPSAEGLLVRRYAQFVSLGGESDELRPARLEGLRAAFDAAVAAERAAAVDGRLLPWIEPIVSEGDRKRLEGQDLLFAADPGLIRSAREPIRQAEARYADTIALLGPLGEAVDLLTELADLLPDYGSWAASDLGRHAMLGTVLDEAAALADRVAGPPSGRDSAASAGAIDEIRDRLGKVRAGYSALRRAFDQEVGRAARPGARAPWRTIDALLKVPAIPVESRMVLLDAVLDADRSPLPAPRPYGSSVEGRGGDEAFWTRALGLSRLELGLLRIAGEPVDDLRGFLGTAETWSTAPDSAFAAMDSFSQGVRRRREALLGAVPRDDPPSRAGRAARDGTDRADWLARSLPSAALHHRFGPSEGPGAARSARDRHDLLVWHGRRLADDLALDLVRDALIAANATGIETPELAEARLDLNRAQSRAIRVENLAAGDDSSSKSPGLAVSGGDDLPPGRAALLLRHDPAVGLEARPRGEAVVAVPVGDRVERRFDIVFAEGADAAPTLFYRGQVFDAGRVAVPQVEQVSVAIRQRYDHAVDDRGNEVLVRGRKIRVPDQFEEHPDEGYLRPNSTLDYRLELTNWTAEPLPVLVSQRLGDGLPKTARVTLPPGQSVARAAVGQVSSIDFGPDGAPLTLAVEVREDGGLGRPLGKPKQVVFRRLEPTDFISIHPHFIGGRVPQVGLYVQHLPTDRTTVPVHVTIAIQPFAAIRRVSSPLLIERGTYGTYRYRIVDPKVETLEFSLTIDGVSNAIVATYKIQELRDEPPPPPPPSDPRAPLP